VLEREIVCEKRRDVEHANEKDCAQMQMCVYGGGDLNCDPSKESSPNVRD
jgi:hypothetical protein